MSALIVAVAVVAIAYFVGSIPIGFLIARRRGMDLRTIGSGNIDAHNVSRALGRGLGILVLVLDALKGALPLLLVFALDLHERADPFVITATGFASICGHCFSIWLRFRGGRGAATTLGVFLVLDPAIAATALLIAGAVSAAFRIVSVGSMAAAVTLPIVLWSEGRPDHAVTLGLAAAGVILFQHRSNIGRLIRGEEPRF
jgi:glycerol-3-phosphate acyltransferase PlsY